MKINMATTDSLSTTNIIDIRNQNSYIDCGIFLVNFTKRNWRGSTYTSNDIGNTFTKQVKSLSEKYAHDFTQLENDRFAFFIDCSVFTQNHDAPTKLYDFLNSLKTDNNDAKQKKLRSKLRYFASKAENFGYLFYWANTHKNHPFTLELLMQLDEEMSQFRNAFDKKFDLSKVGDENDEVFNHFNKYEEDSITKLTKYSYVSPIHFLFNAYFVRKWFDNYHEMTSLMGSTFVVTQFITDKKILTDIYQGNQFHESCMVFEPLMGNFLGLIAHENGPWKTGNLYHLETEINTDKIFEKHEINGEVLKSVAQWATSKIEKERNYNLPTHSWFADVEWEFLKEAGVQQITFIDDKIVQGPNDKELVVHAKLSLGNSTYIVMPLIAPKNWGDLSLFAKAVMTYALCLYHDITVENAFSMHEDKTSQYIPLPMHPKPEKLVFEGKKFISKAKETHKKQNEGDAQKRTHKKHREHWVTFHFRKLHEGSKSSEEARDKATKYGIDLPEGYTFIDSHVRGTEASEVGEVPKVSALDIFNRMFK